MKALNQFLAQGILMNDSFIKDDRRKNNPKTAQTKSRLKNNLHSKWDGLEIAGINIITILR